MSQEIPIPRPRPEAADKAFEKADQSFSAKTPDCPTGNCNDDCAKCQEEMKKALQGKAFDNKAGRFSAQDLNNASITTFGELSAPYAGSEAAVQTQTRESDAVAASVFNRSNAVLDKKRPRGSNFAPGNTDPTMSGVASVDSQYKGHAKGKEDLKAMTNKKMNKEECKRMCQRWRRAKGSVEKFANDPKALEDFNNKEGKFYYNRAARQDFGMRNQKPGQVRIGGNDFSEFPM